MIFSLLNNFTIFPGKALVLHLWPFLFRKDNNYLFVSLSSVT